MTDKSTKDKILDAAEQVMADQGIGGASMRSITAAAGVNLAAIHYHFGSKPGLIRALLERRVAPVNRARLSALQSALDQAAPDLPTLENVVRSFIAPTLNMRRDPERGEHLICLAGRLHSEPGEEVQVILRDLFQELTHHYMQVLRDLLPDLKPQDLFWRYFFLVGSMAFTMSDRRKLSAMSGGLCDADDVDTAIEELVAYACGGLRAAAARSTPSEQPS